MEEDDELQEMAQATQALARAVVEEVRELAPSPAQWARARALTEARDWVTGMFGFGISEDAMRNLALETAEALTLRWAKLIETGEVQGSE